MEMEMRLEERKAFTVVGIKKRLPIVDGNENVEGIIQMWSVLKDDKANDLVSLSNEALPGLIGVSANNDGQCFDYYIGVTVDDPLSKNSWDQLEIPSSTWAVFIVKGSLPAAMVSTWQRIFIEWFPSSGYQSVNAPNLEVYSEGDPNADDYLSELWVPVKLMVA